MYVEVDNAILDEIEKITMTEYSKQNGMLEADSVEPMLNDLLCEIHHLEDKIKSLENDIENNYELKNINPYEEYGVSEKDFI